MAQPSIVGRDSELRELDCALVAARTGRGSAVFIVGEPGVGKSRLADECARRAAATGVRVLRGRGSTIGPTVPFRALTEALFSLFRAEELPVPDGLGTYRPVLGRLVPDWRHPPAPDNDSLIVLAEAVLRLTAVLGEDTGCLLVLEDLDVAEPETVAVVEYLIDNLDRLPTALVATVKEEPSTALDVARSAAQRRSATLLELPRLDQKDTGLLVAACLGGTPEDLPASTITRLWEKSAGVPLVAEELLRSMVGDGALVAGPSGWQELSDELAEVPPTVLRTITRRTSRLPAECHPLLLAAAVLGDRFSLPVVRQMTGMDDRTVLGQLHMTASAGLVVADVPAPDWYSFRYPLTAPALLAALTPAGRADLARRAAAAVDVLYPGLPGEWCHCAASLRLRAGDAAGAATLFAEAGRRALAGGDTASAIALLERAAGMRPGDVEVIEPMLYALAETEEFTRATRLVDTLLSSGDGARLAPERKAALHLQLAWGAGIVGQDAEGLARVRTARALLGSSPAAEHAARFDAVAATLALETPGKAGALKAELLARRALRTADRVPLPAVTCQSLLVAGSVARERDMAESNSYFERARLAAEEYRLPIWQIRAQARLAGNSWLAEGDVSGLERVRVDAYRVGATAVGNLVTADIAMHLVLCGRFAEAKRLIGICRSRLGDHGVDVATRNLHLAGAVLAAHQGRRREMDEALADFYRSGGRRAKEYPLSLGLARVFCALLEEDGDRARRELARPHGDGEPPAGGIAGGHGLRLLLDVLPGDAGWRQYDKVAGAPVSRLRWNHQFVVLARAVLLGRSGQLAEATAAVAEAQRLALDYVTARHLGLRLVADSAITDGWGRPEEWLRAAEQYFHQASVPAVASACRGLLRQTGVAVPQRRTGTEGVPAALRVLGVTVREYDVFRLLVEPLGNKTIAGRLHISPRTVEKHVANLVLKTGQPGRDALHEYAAAMLEEHH